MTLHPEAEREAALAGNTTPPASPVEGYLRTNYAGHLLSFRPNECDICALIAKLREIASSPPPPTEATIRGKALEESARIRSRALMEVEAAILKLRDRPWRPVNRQDALDAVRSLIGTAPRKGGGAPPPTEGGKDFAAGIEAAAKWHDRWARLGSSHYDFLRNPGPRTKQKESLT